MKCFLVYCFMQGIIPSQLTRIRIFKIIPRKNRNLKGEKNPNISQKNDFEFYWKYSLYATK